MPVTAYETIKQQLLARVRPDAPSRDYFHKAIEGAFTVLSRFEAERDRINADARFTDQGKRLSIAALVEDHFAPELAKDAARVARRATQRITSRRTALGRPTFDTSNLVAALERREVRDYLRSQPDSKRMQIAFDLVRERSTAEAILSGATLALTGLTPDQSAMVHKQYLQTHFSDQLRDLDLERRDIEAVAAAVEIVRKKLLAASGKSEHDFAEAWEEQQKLSDAA